MYTYETFESFGVFTLMRPVFYVSLALSIGLFVMVLLLKRTRKLLNGFAVVSLSAVIVVLSGQVLVYDSIIVDELGLGGDSLSFWLFLAIAGFGLITPLVYFVKRAAMPSKLKKV